MTGYGYRIPSSFAKKIRNESHGPADVLNTLFSDCDFLAVCICSVQIDLFHPVEIGA